MAVEQLWAFSGNDQDAPFAIFVSGAIQMRRSGNVFVTFGGVILAGATYVAYREHTLNTSSI